MEVSAQEVKIPHPDLGHLCFTRKAGERFWIGDDICVELVSASGPGERYRRPSAVIKVIAPRSVPIRREEVKLRPPTEDFSI